MNEFIDILLKHKSIRKYSDKTIPKELFESIVCAGQAASTSSHIQAVSIVRVTDTVKRRTLMQLCGEQAYVASAAEFLVCCADFFRISQLLNSQDTSEFDSIEHCITATVDTAIFAQNMVVAAESSGLGCCYIGGIRNNPQQLSDLLCLPELVYPVFGLCMGYPAHQPDVKPRLPQEVLLHENEYSFGEQKGESIAFYDEQVRQYYLSRTKGRLNKSWTEQMSAYVQDKQRAHLSRFLKNKGFAIR